MVSMAMPVAIGAAFRLEWFSGFVDGCSELAQHVGDDVVRPDQQSFSLDLERDVAIANVPSQAGVMGSVTAADREELLGQGANLDDRVIVEQEAITIMEPDRFRQVEQKGCSVIADHGEPPATSCFVIEGHGVERRPRPAALRHGADRPHQSEKIALGHRQDLGRLTGQEHAIGAHLIGFRVDLDVRGRRIPDH